MPEAATDDHSAPLLLRGGPLSQERQVARDGLTHRSQAAFVIHRRERATEDLAFTLAVLIFHAMGLERWQRGFAEDEGRGEAEPVAVLALRAQQPLPDGPENRYVGIGPLERRKSHPYVRTRDVGALRETLALEPLITLYPKEIAERIRPADRRQTERFFVGPSARRYRIGVDAWPCCESVALSLLERESWLRELQGADA